MPDNAEHVRQYRARQRKKGLRLVQLWLPVTASRAFARQVARDIAATAELAPADAEMLDTFERTPVDDTEWR
jgi:hypothetical protein